MAESQTIDARPLSQDITTSLPDLPPATLEEELAWITQYDSLNEPFAEYICAARHKAVYGTWPDGEPHPMPNVEHLPPWKVSWLLGQSNPSKWDRVRRRGLGPVRRRDRTDEAFPGQRQWLREQKRRSQEERRMRNQTRRPRHPSRNPLPTLIAARSAVREWFMLNIQSSGHEEWAAMFLELRDLEQKIVVAEATAKHREIRRESRNPISEAATLPPPVQTAPLRDDDRVSVSPLGYAVLARRQRRSA